MHEGRLWFLMCIFFYNKLAIWNYKFYSAKITGYEKKSVQNNNSEYERCKSEVSSSGAYEDKSKGNRSSK